MARQSAKHCTEMLAAGEAERVSQAGDAGATVTKLVTSLAATSPQDVVPGAHAGGFFEQALEL